jgi:hypothetical protein
MANIVLNGEKLKPFAVVRKREEHPLSPFLLSTVLEFLAREI